MPGSQQDRRAAREGHRIVVLEDLRAAVQGIHLVEAEEGSHPAAEGVVPEVHHKRLAVAEEVGPTKNPC
jgi:hypothetical protein